MSVLQDTVERVIIVDLDSKEVLGSISDDGFKTNGKIDFLIQYRSNVSEDSWIVTTGDVVYDITDPEQVFLVKEANSSLFELSKIYIEGDEVKINNDVVRVYCNNIFVASLEEYNLKRLESSTKENRPNETQEN